jgi:chemotaxis protein methyltransferase CheR
MSHRNQPAINENELAEIRAFVENRSGLLFNAERERLFLGRVREHLEARRLAHGAELLRLMRGSSSEYELLLERVLTRDDQFFRYPALFQALEKRILPEIHMRKFWDNPRSLRIWSAGCGAGHEPYSIALTVADVESADAWIPCILATDIRRQALQHGERGVYSNRELQSLEPRQLEAYFARIADHFLIKPRIRNMVTFSPLNLAQCTYMGRFDCIFCTDALAYFDAERRAALLQRFFDYLDPGGFMVLNPDEAPAKIPAGFQTMVHGGVVLYQRPNSPATLRGTLAPEL